MLSLLNCLSLAFPVFHLQLIGIICHSVSCSILGSASDLPHIDLGYATYSPSYSRAGDYYNFTNIRYAAAPLGENRFRPPVAPRKTDAVVNGSHGYICPQVLPDWFTSAVAGLGDDEKYLGFPTSVGHESEDCLFLDVIVPRSAYRNKEGLPVMVWIYGGNYQIGDKATGYDSAGLLARSSNKVIFVAMNYRLSAFGFLTGGSGPGNESTANVGLLDQNFALQWIHKHISRFGGDPAKVMIMGESAGAGSVQHHISAFGGSATTRDGYKQRLFRAALLQSPYPTVVSPAVQKLGFDRFLEALNVSSLDEARRLPSSQLMAANLAIGKGYSVTLFAPTVEPGGLIPDYPNDLLTQGRFDDSVKVMLGHNGDEGRLFTPQIFTSDANYSTFLAIAYPDASAATRTYLSTVVYPPIYNGSQPYTTPLERLTLTNAEASPVCATDTFARAFGNATYNYIFDVPPGIHTQDIPYTFYSPNSSSTTPASTAPVNASLAQIMQGYFVNFALYKDPNGPRRRHHSNRSSDEDGRPSRRHRSPDGTRLPEFPDYGRRARALDLSDQRVASVRARGANPRCRFWATRSKDLFG